MSAAYMEKTTLKRKTKRPAAKPLSLEERTDVTIDELEANPPDYSFELIDGKVVRKMPNFDHGVLIAKISRLLGNYLETNSLGLISVDANYRLSPANKRESRAPDISFIRKERIPSDTNTFLTVTPDLAVEIISPTDKMNDVFDKARLYITQGVQEVWLVLRQTKEILVYTPDGIRSARNVLTTPLLPGFEINLNEIFA